MSAPLCTCHNPACAIRIGRGLTPFCQLSTTATAPVAFGSYSAAAAAANGQRVRSVTVSGGPKQFILEEARA